MRLTNCVFFVCLVMGSLSVRVSVGGPAGPGSAPALAESESALRDEDLQYLTAVYSLVFADGGAKSGQADPAVRRLIYFKGAAIDDYVSVVSPLRMRTLWNSVDRSELSGIDLSILCFVTLARIGDELDRLDEIVHGLPIFYQDVGIPMIDDDIDWQTIDARGQREEYLKKVEAVNRANAQIGLQSKYQVLQSLFERETKLFLKAAVSVSSVQTDLLKERAALYGVDPGEFVDWLVSLAGDSQNGT